MPRLLKKPSLLHHKGTGQAYSRVGGRCFYFGEHGTQEAKIKYDKFTAMMELGMTPPGEEKDENRNRIRSDMYSRLWRSIQAVDKARADGTINAVSKRNVRNVLKIIAENSEFLSMQMVDRTPEEIDKCFWQTVRGELQKKESLSSRAVYARVKQAKQFWDATKDSQDREDEPLVVTELAETVE